jgi:signal transduction histidine kinase
VRRRILFAIIAATAVGVVVFAVPLGFALAKLYHEEEVVQLERTAAEAAERIPLSYPESSALITLPRTRNRRTVSMYDSSAVRVTGNGPDHGDSVVRSALEGDAHNRQTGKLLVFATPVIRGNGVVAALRVATPLSTVTDRTRDAVFVMLGIGVLAIGASALLATWQSRRLAQPVTRLAQDATRLGDGDFTVRTGASGIAEIDAVSRALEQTAGRLDDLLTRERAFSADASHQLRTPLTGLRLTLEAAALDPGADRDAAIAIAIEEVDRLEGTIDDLLELAREVPAERPHLDLDGFLAGLDRDWDARLLGSGRLLRLEIDHALPPVAISDRALRQILDVLIDNARIHGAGRITVRARRAPPGVVVEVCDEGDGITGETTQIFERRAPGSFGHGIGLALARSLADAEGARLVLEHAAPHPIFAVVLPTTSVREPEPALR